MRRTLGVCAAGILAIAALAGCGAPTNGGIPPLPVGISNNAVAAVQTPTGAHLYSFTGLEPGKTYRDVSRRAFSLAPDADRWVELEPAPGPARLAASAITLGGDVLLIGGYTVAADHTEVSTPEIWRLHAGRWSELARMPTPVDDAVVAVHEERYLILISGWSNDDNVDLVQVLDVETGRWHASTPWPGPPVFGHAGALAGDTLVVCDGVLIEPLPVGRRFAPSPHCYAGTIVTADASRIEWREIEHHSGVPLYRMAAVAHPERREVMFAGGSATPYNYNGIGYDERPALASARYFSRDVDGARWVEHAPLPTPTMDHRGLLIRGDQVIIVGGMRNPQLVSATSVAAPVR